MRKLLAGFCCLFLLFLPFACTYDQVEVVEACDNNLVITLVEQTASACGLASGAFTAAISGEAADLPVAYSLNGGDVQDGPSFTNLPAGSYTLTADQGACAVTLEVTLDNAEGLNASLETIPTACGSTNGIITIETTDASGQVSFSIDGGAVQSEASFTGLAPGTYEVTAEDEIGCRVTLEATIFSTIAFDDVEAIVTASCALSGCHAGNISPDFRVRENILAQSGRIRARTSNASMPPPSSGGSLTDAQIDAIACWVADGAPE